MNSDKFISALQSAVWMIDPMWGLGQYANYQNEVNLIESGASPRDILSKYSMDDGQPSYLTLEGKPTQEASGIASIYMSGMMTAEGGICARGIRDMISDMESLDANPNVKGLLIEMNSGGGHATAGFMLNQAIHDFSKPIVTLGHFVGSAAYLAASASDEIIGAGSGSQFGSIGALMQFSNQALESLKDDYTTLYSSLSGKKNREVRSLLAGDHGPMIEHLDKLAGSFISEVKSNRKINNKEVFEGSMYMANEAKNSGLIDNIGTKSKAIQILNRHIKLRK